MHVRSKCARVSRNLKNPYPLHRNHCLSASTFHMMSISILLCFTKPDVEEGNIIPFLRHFGADKLTREKKLRRIMGTF